MWKSWHTTTRVQSVLNHSSETWATNEEVWWKLKRTDWMMVRVNDGGEMGDYLFQVMHVSYEAIQSAIEMYTNPSLENSLWRICCIHVSYAILKRKEFYKVCCLIFFFLYCFYMNYMTVSTWQIDWLWWWWWSIFYTFLQKLKELLRSHKAIIIIVMII